MSGGRWGLNVVSGWNHAEFSMMGLEIHDHDKRYEKTTAYLEVIKGLWTSEPGTFDFESEWYNIKGGWISPLPKASPHPPIVNAGTSDAGRNLVANYCDWSFMCPPSIDGGGEMAQDIKKRASEVGRTVRCVAALIPIWGDTQSEAEALTQKILDNADKEALESWMAGTQLDSESFDSHTLDMFCIGAGSLPIIGTRETVAEALVELYKQGVDGAMMGVCRLSGWHSEIRQRNRALATRSGDQINPSRSCAYTPVDNWSALLSANGSGKHWQATSDRRLSPNRNNSR